MATSTTEVSQPEIKSLEYAQLNDDGLLVLVGERRDRDALAELYYRYRIIVRGFLQKKMSEPALFEEVYNDVMLTVWEKANSFRGASKVSTWIFGIAYRTRLAHNRKESRHKHNKSDEFVINAGVEDETTLENQTSSSETLRAALAELSEQHRSVIVLAYFYGYSTQEISDILGCPKNTVKTRLFHARKKLKTTLETDQSEGTVIYSDKSNAQQQNYFKAPEWQSDHICRTVCQQQL